jgi:polyketide biosynthesis acyl carrier protein
VRRIVDETIRAILPQLGSAEIPGNAHIKDLGADSVERVEIITGIVDRMGLRTPLARFADIPNVDALVSFLLEARDRG